MFVSAEIISIVLTGIGLILTLGAMLLAGFAWCVRRIDAVERRVGDRIDALDQMTNDRSGALERTLSARIDALDQKTNDRSGALERTLSARIDALDQKASDRSDALEKNLGARIDALAADITELKITVARLEGPVRHLIVPGR